MRKPTIRVQNQNTKRTSHYVTDIITFRQLHPGVEAATPDEEKIKRLASTGEILEEYPVTTTGLSDALSDALAGQTVFLPLCEITGDFTVPSEVTLLGTSTTGSKLFGTISLNDLSILDTLWVDNNTTDDPTVVVGVYGPEDGYNIDDPEVLAMATMRNVVVDVGSTAGPAYALMLTCGSITAYTTELLALEGIYGYAAYVEFGTLNHVSGRAVGNDPDGPYWLEV